MIGFFKEIHLFFRCLPHLIDNTAKINQVSGACRKIQKPGSLFYQGNVLRHGLFNPGTLNFQDHRFSRF